MRLNVASAPYAKGTSRRMFQSSSTGTSATTDTTAVAKTKSHSGTPTRSLAAAVSAVVGRCRASGPALIGRECTAAPGGLRRNSGC